jgi:hypothetical protein
VIRPFPAGTGDLSIFKHLEKGLKYKMPFGTKAIADHAYTSKSVCATRNDEFDDPRVRKFKCRAQGRHENFNMHIKVYNVMLSKSIALSLMWLVFLCSTIWIIATLCLKCRNRAQ